MDHLGPPWGPLEVPGGCLLGSTTKSAMAVELWLHWSVAVWEASLRPFDLCRYPRLGLDV